MATTAKGTPYVVSTDLVANYPTVSSDLADHIDDNLAYNAVSINAQTGTTYTFALADASEGKLVTASNAAASTYTVPPQSSVTWASGAVLRILNQGAGVVTIAAGAGVTINGTPLTLAQYKGAAIQRTASNTWTFIPFSGGVGNAAISDTPTGTYTGYQYWTYNSSGTLNVTTAGLADVLLIGGGGSGGASSGGGGGAGGHVYITDVYLPSGALTVTVGAGGTAPAITSSASTVGQSGNPSRLGPYYAPGGGGGGAMAYQFNSTNRVSQVGQNGGSGGGAGGFQTGASSAAGTGMSGIGSNGGTGAGEAGGGGGGGSAVGSNASTNTGGNGGAGTANSITGSSVTRAGGGGGSGASTQGTGGTGGGGGGAVSGTATSGTANTGGGGGGEYGRNTNEVGGNGGSGVVIIRVAV